MGNLCSATTLFVPATVVSLLTLTGPLVLAQPIVPNADGTGTQVTQSGNQIDITGGTMAGSNQFHSFEQFNVPTDNTANFVTPAHTDNVLGRVNGGSASIIDGTVRVTGSDANLYLMNPSGVVFGENARLDVPGSFNATSATGIGVGDGEFSATGQNNYGSLVGAPNSFNFDQPTGAVVNHGDLAVSEGKSLNLVGTTVENRGSLSAPGGSVNVIAVPGAGDRVRIEQAGMVLNLEVANDNTAITPTSLPKRLTGGDLDHANTLEVGPDGVARLTTRPSAAPGTVVVSGTAGNPARINADRVQVTGGQVIVENAAISATGNQTQVLLQATQGAAAVSNSTANLANLAGIGGLLRIRGAGVAVEQSQIRLTGSTTGQVQIESRAQGAALGTALSGLEDGITAEIAVGNTTIADSQISVELGADIGATGPIVTGQVDILGPGQVLIASSDIAANQVRIGGDFQGQGEVVTAQDTIVDASSTISTLLSPFAAHANLPLSSDSPQSPSANPGRVIVWADDKTRFLGYLHNPAGFAEVSGKNELNLGENWSSQIQVKTLLLDPNDIEIRAGSGPAITGSPTNANILYSTRINNFLQNNGNLIIQTTGAGGNGDITVNGALSWSANQLALYADRNIQINADLAITGTGSVRMAFGQGTTDGSGATYTVANGVSIKIPLPTGSQTTATSAFTWQQGSAGTVNQLVFNNGYLAFGTGSHQQGSAANTSAVNPQGLLTQPNYFDNVTAGRNAYYKLTYSSNPLNLEIGTGTGGTRWNGNTTFASTQGGTYTPQAGGYLEISGYRPGVGSGPGGGPKGSGVIESVVPITIGGINALVTNQYSLGAGDSFLAATTSIKATTTTPLQNVGLWTGTQDDWVGTTDGPTKTLGTLTGSGFTAISTVGSPANVLRVDEVSGASSGASVLFYATDPAVRGTHSTCCQFTNATSVNPASAQIQRSGDGSYALYNNLGNIAPGSEAGFDWYYAAAPAANINSVIQNVAQAAAGTTYDFLVSGSLSNTASTVYDGTAITLESVFSQLTLNVDNTTINVRDGSTVNYTFELNGQAISSFTDAGNYSEIRPVLSSTLAQLYTLNHTTSTGGTLIIDPKPIAVSGLTANHKTYDGSNAAVITIDPAFTDQIIASDITGVSVTGSFADRHVVSNQSVTPSLTGSRAFNYTLSGTLSASITRLESATWVGPDTGGQWFDPNNWATSSDLTIVGAIPDRSNVSNVIIPATNTVLFDQTITTQGDPVNLTSLTGGNLKISNGTLAVSGLLEVDNLTLDANVFFTAGDLSVVETARLAANINTTSSQTLNNLILENDVILKANDPGGITPANINLLGTINGGFSLTLNSSGLTDIQGAIGGKTALTSLTTDAAGTTRLGSNITTTGDQTFNDAVTLASASTLKGGNLTFANTINGAFGLALNSTGLTDIQAAIGGKTALTSLTTDAAGTTRLGSNITTTGAQTFNDAITLASAATLTGQTINLSGAITSNNTLTLNTDTFNLTGTLQGSGDLAIVPIDTTRNISLGLAVPGTLDLDRAELANLQDGFNRITIGRADGTGTATLATGVTFLDPIVLAGGSTLYGPDQPLSWTLDSPGGGSGLGLGETVQFANFEGLVMGSADDRLQVSGGSMSSVIDAGAGLATVSGADVDLTQVGDLRSGGTLVFDITNNLNLGNFSSGGAPLSASVGGTISGGTVSTLSTTGGTSGSINLSSNTIRLDTLLSGNTVAVSTTNALSIGNLSSSGQSITLSSNGSLAVNTLTSAGTTTLSGGSVSLGTLSSAGATRISSNSTLSTGTLSSGSTLNLTSAGAMTTGNLSGSAITANSGTTLVAANLNALGPINLSSIGDLVTGNLYTPGQAINLTSTTGSITTGNAITASSTGGSIFYNARTEITAGTIDSSGSVGSGGNVKLDPIGDIQVVSINTQAGVSGTGGIIDITAGRFFRAIGSFIDRNGQEASLSARGGTGGGTITIRHGGGNLSVPFVTGDTTLNGTRAGLVTGFGRMASDVTILGPLTESGVNLITAGVSPTTLSLCTTGCQGLQGLAPMQESQSLLLLAAAFQESLLGTAPSSSDAATSGDATSTPATTGTVGDTGSIATATDSQASTATGSTAAGSTAAGSTATGSTATGSTASPSTAASSTIAGGDGNTAPGSATDTVVASAVTSSGVADSTGDSPTTAAGTGGNTGANAAGANTGTSTAESSTGATAGTETSTDGGASTGTTDTTGTNASDTNTSGDPGADSGADPVAGAAGETGGEAGTGAGLGAGSEAGLGAGSAGGETIASASGTTAAIVAGAAAIAAVAAAVATGAASSVAAAIASAVATSAAGATGAAGTAGASSAAAGAANASSAANAANTSQSNTSQTDASQSNSESSNVEGDSQSQGENQTQNMTEMDVSVDSQLGQGGPNIAINKLGGATEMTMPTIALDNRPDWDTATEEENKGPSFADILALTELFGTEEAEDSGAADSEKKVAQAERRAALQAKLEEQASALPGTLVEYTTGMVIEKLGELLEEIQVVGDLLAFAWSKSVELSEYYKEIQADPGESFAVPLVNHEVVSEQAPSIELKLKEQAIGNLEININAGIVVDGVLLQVENGKITGLKIGNAIASGSIEILGQTLVEAPEVELELPGVISLGEGIPLFGINPETAGGETA